MRTKKWLGYALIVFFAAMAVYLWTILGDPIGVALSLVVLALFVFLGLAVLAYVVRSVPALLRRLRGTSQEEHLADLERRGTAVRERYSVERALQFEDLNTGCNTFLLDVGSSGVLCLYGQDYYEYEDHEVEPASDRVRVFPTTEFSILRHVAKNQLIGFEPGSEVIEPIAVKSLTDYESLFALGIRLEDGATWPNADFDAIVDALANR